MANVPLWRREAVTPPPLSMRAQSAGSPSIRGKHPHTIRASRSTSAAMLQLPMTPRSSDPNPPLRGNFELRVDATGRDPPRKLLPDLRRRSENMAGACRAASDTHRDAARGVHGRKAGLVRDIIANKD